MKDRIPLYAALSDEERREVERYVEDHPRFRPDLEEAKAFEALFRDARILEEDPPSDAALAHYVVTRRLQKDGMPDLVAQALDGLEQRIARDAVLRARVEEMEQRRAELESESHAAERFAQLTSRRQPVAEGDPPNVRYLWRAAAAVVALAALYSVLYEIGMRIRPDHERMARFRGSELVLEGYETARTGDAVEPSSATAAYVGALEQLRRAESSFIGLFPRFDVARLDSAHSLLRLVVVLEPDGSFLESEAQFLLGKTHLARGDLTAARNAFVAVEAAGGRRADEAVRLLAWMAR